MAPIISQRTPAEQEIMRKNEINANKALIKGSIATAVVLVVLLICYAAGLFKASPKVLLSNYISFPIMIVILGTTVFYGKTKYIAHPGFKYFLLYQLITVIFVLNILLPKHAILGWAICILVANHYFNPKVTLITFVSIAVLMFIALYSGMLYGEWDANILNANDFIELNGTKIAIADVTFEQRVEWLRYLRDNGNNRYLIAFLYYYLPRMLTVGILAFVSFAISKRASDLLKEEISITKQNQKIQGELEVARNIQASVLPRTFPNNDIERIYAMMDPAKEVGGDFYDYFYIDDTHIAFTIADVSGKGVPAALLMMKTETLVKSLATSLRSDTATIMERSNIALCANNDATMFVTCWLGILDTVTGELRYTNAGHNSPIIYTNGEVRYLKGAHSMVLGGLETVKYKEQSVKLNQGDKLILYTDGVTEAHNIKEELFGEDRLLAFATEHINDAANEFIPALRQALNDFSEGKEQFDDITMLMVEFHKGAHITSSRVFKADTRELHNLFNYSSSLLEILNFSKRDITMINTALEEVFVNVAKYAYKGEGAVEVSLSNEKDSVRFVFRDAGKQFNPLDWPDPKITADSDERDIGGLGIYMAKNIMDEVLYEYVDGCNVLTLVKNRKY